MFDKDHYRDHPELRKQLNEEHRKLEELAKGATEPPEELRKRARSLGTRRPVTPRVAAGGNNHAGKRRR